MKISGGFIFGGVVCFLARLASTASIPTNDGFPNPSTTEEFTDLARKAGGSTPKSSPPSKLGPGTTTALQLIAFSELFETAFFNSLLHNITNDAPGYHTRDTETYEKVLRRVLAQEEIHAVSALNALKHGHASFVPQPCQYKFPGSNSIEHAIEIAETFTAVVLGSLQDATAIFSEEDSAVLAGVTTAIAGNEGEQNGWYRSLLQDVPSESPFLTFVPGAFAFSALQMFIESCPFNLDKIDLPVFPPMTVNGGPIAILEPRDQKLSFVADLSNCSDSSYKDGKGGKLFLTYTTGQQIPFSVPMEDVRWSGNKVSFTAAFPFSEYTMEGFSHAALTTTGNFTSPGAVVNATLAAPAIIQVRDLA